MSGPVILTFGSGAINGAEINPTAFPIDGFSGTMGLFVELVNDEQVFELLIAGRIRAKEGNCADARTPADKAPRTPSLVPVCSKVKP